MPSVPGLFRQVFIQPVHQLVGVHAVAGAGLFNGFHPGKRTAQAGHAEIWDAEAYDRLEAETLTPENLAAVMEELDF